MWAITPGEWMWSVIICPGVDVKELIPYVLRSADFDTTLGPTYFCHYYHIHGSHFHGSVIW